MPRWGSSLVQTDPTEMSFFAGTRCYAGQPSLFFRIAVGPMPTSRTVDALSKPSPLTPQNAQPVSHNVQPASQNVQMTPQKPTVATGPTPPSTTVRTRGSTRPRSHRCGDNHSSGDPQWPWKKTVRTLQQRMKREKNPIKRLMLANELREKMKELKRL